MAAAYKFQGIKEGGPPGSRIELVAGWEEVGVAAHALVHT